ncbi:hypothetical protein GYMLUDRAFT_72152 [Collybiopsis luxurians FD-317 M1]|uniref:Uncharacterized protein n=1 Tax=Collybiopsis luxurians FD-317 M1 TaxID=944289 RepID=A0A0D0CV75_9AGAR|nr:hypothetical protein GYMLUDRAFT_72152 [Collybiopsis luxurians FD-317 M1]
MSKSTKPQLCSLGEWAVKGTTDIYLAKTRAEAEQAVDKVFAPNVHSWLNGKRLSKDQLYKLLLDLRHPDDSEESLGFYWSDYVHAAIDPTTERDGTLCGVYVVTNVLLPHPQTGELVPHIRRKAISIVIESQSQDLSIDSRRVVELVTVARNIPQEQAKAAE